MPLFPSEIACLLSLRIGEIKNTSDIWYEVSAQTDELQQKEQIVEDIQQHVLPYLDSVTDLRTIIELAKSEKYCNYVNTHHLKALIEYVNSNDK